MTKRGERMTIEDDIAFFEQIPTLGLLGRAALRILAIGAESRSVRGGEVLFYAGDSSDAGYVVQEGSFTLTPPKGNRNGREEVAGRGTLLGELAMITETPRPVTATAREASTVIRISRGLFLKMLEGYPDTARRLRDSMAARADQWTREMDVVRAGLEKGDGKGK
jgi:CRP-like cAMP-binding protein